MIVSAVGSCLSKIIGLGRIYKLLIYVIPSVVFKSASINILQLHLKDDEILLCKFRVSVVLRVSIMTDDHHRCLQVPVSAISLRWMSLSVRYHL